MKLKKGFVLREVAGKCVAVPTGTDINFNGMITLNGPGETIWKALEEGKDFDGVLAILKAEYDAPEELLKKDLTAFLEKMRKYNILED